MTWINICGTTNKLICLGTMSLLFPSKKNEFIVIFILQKKTSFCCRMLEHDNSIQS
jgi:hypothetical protein